MAAKLMIKGLYPPKEQAVVFKIRFFKVLRFKKMELCIKNPNNQ